MTIFFFSFQVININSCIKAALDFISPERLSLTLKSMYEFTSLTSEHQNKQDKCQLKNVIYHTAKEIIKTKTLSGKYWMVQNDVHVLLSRYLINLYFI